MSKPIVAIVDRPSVGKSTLFNVIARDTIFIVGDTPGMTRNRIYTNCKRLNMNFTLIDTGGIEPDSKDIILPQMREQAEIAIPTADVIVFIVDVCQGLVDADSEVADLLRRSRKPAVLTVDKVDSVTKYDNDVYEFYNLEIGGPIAVSAASRLGIDDPLDEVVKHFDSGQMEEEEGEQPRIAMAGKSSVGKSSIINRLLGEDRVIVSSIADTARDVVGTETIYKGTPYVFIDMAGLRRKGKIKEGLEHYSVIHTVSVMERAGTVVMVIDAIESITEQDAKIAGIAHERGEGITMAINKWDAIEETDKTIYEYAREIKEILSFIPYTGFLSISATTGQRLTKLFEMTDVVHQNQNLEVTTGVLNEIMTETVTVQQSPLDKGKWLKIYYMTQVAVRPPTFVIFVNDKELMHFSYTRHLENQIRNAFDFEDTSLKFLIKE